MKSPLAKYKLGLLVIGLFVVGMLVFVLVQAGATSQDTKTDKAANDAADKLNSYVTRNQTVPSSLAEAGVKDVPSTISYTKLSDSSYKFCVTYKTTSSGFDPSQVTSDLTTGNSVNNYSYDYSSSSYLYLPPTHKKGQNCQTITDNYLNPNYCIGNLSATDNCYMPMSSSSNSSSSSGSYKGLNSYQEVQAKARDTERQTDIKALQSQLEAYFASNGNYPSRAEMNSATWFTTNMPGLDKEALKDPQGTGYTLAATPSQKTYSYAPLDQDGKSCENDATTCVSFTLTAMLENGTSYSKQSLGY